MSISIRRGLAVAVLALGAVSATAVSRPTASSTPDLWPKLAAFQTMAVADLVGGTGDQQLAATTLEGAYNQLQGSNRLYVVQRADDQTWLTDNVLPGVQQTTLPGSGPGGQLRAMLAAYGPDIKGAILFNPADPDTINLATTMAGVDDAMVAAPSQRALLRQYGIPVIHSFAGQTFASPAAAYQWEFSRYIHRTNRSDLVILNPADDGSLRDYIVATKSFVFYLTSTDSSQEPLMNQIISARPAKAPTLGYIADEGPDVADLSSLGHFLNASDFLDNESDWAGVPGVAHLTQPRPQPVRAQDNTVYVSFMVSDGDNAQYDQHRMFDVWTAGPDLGAVPEGWTTAPGMADFAPSMISWFYQHLPRDSELLPGPSGVGYATQMTGTDLQQFGQLSGGFMRKDTMSSVDFWEPASQVAAYAQASGAPAISVDAPLAYTQEGNTAVIGQTSGYTDPASTLLSTIEQDVLSQPGSGPVFLDPLVDGWGLTPQDILAIGQALATWGKTAGKHFVFTTPSELALTEGAYEQGSGGSLPRLNAQAVPGSALLKLPPAGQLQGYTPPVPGGPNLVSNPSGQSGTFGWTATAGTLSAGTYQGGPDLSWSVPTAEPGQEWAHTYPAVTDGDTYQFSVQVAGSGQVFLDTYDGAEDLQSPAINLTSAYQTLTWSATIPSDAPGGQTGNAPQLQVREAGIGPETVYIQNATVQLATPSP